VVPYSRASRTKRIKREALHALLDPTVFCFDASSIVAALRFVLLIPFSLSLSLSLSPCLLDLHCVSSFVQESLVLVVCWSQASFASFGTTNLWLFSCLKERGKEGRKPERRDLLLCFWIHFPWLYFERSLLCCFLFAVALRRRSWIWAPKTNSEKCLLVGRRERESVCVCFQAIRSVVTNEAKKLSFVEIFGRFVSALPFCVCSVSYCHFEEFVEILFSLIAAFSDLLCINDLCWIAWIVGAERVAF
jgi:hypothetical protein